MIMSGPGPPSREMASRPCQPSARSGLSVVKPIQRAPLGAVTSREDSLKFQPLSLWACRRRLGKSWARTWRSTPAVLMTVELGKVARCQRIRPVMIVEVLPEPLAVRRETRAPESFMASNTSRCQEGFSSTL